MFEALEAAEDHLVALASESADNDDMAAARAVEPGYSPELLAFFETRQHDADGVLVQRR